MYHADNIVSMETSRPRPSGPITITAAADLLRCSRQTASKHVAALGIGTRLGTADKSPIFLSPAEFSRLWKEFQKKDNPGKFKQGNDLHSLRKNPGRKKRVES